MDRFKLDVEYIVSTDRLFRRGEGTYMEGGNGGSTSMGCMGIDLIDKKAGI